MSIIHLTNPSGLRPRFEHSQNKGAFAHRAIDVDLSNGDLRPFRLPLQLTTGSYQNAYYCSCDIVSLEDCEVVTNMTVERDCYQIKSGIGEPTLVCGGCCDDQPLALPTPTNPPELTHTHDESRSSASRYYAYSFVDCFGRESIVSPPSHHVTVTNGDSVFVSGFSDVPDVYCIDHINIYRSATGFRSGSEELQEGSTSLFYVGRVDAPTDVFMDDVLDRNLGKVCVCEDNYPPVEGLRGIQLYVPTNQLVGFEGKNVHFSTGGQSHIFPIEYMYSFDYAVKSIGVGRDGVYVFTFGGDQYFLSNISCEPKSCATVTPIKIPRLVGTSIAKKIKDTVFGVTYVSQDGLAVLNNGQCEIITSPWFSTNDWREMRLETMRIGYGEHKIFFTTDDESYALFIDPKVSDMENRHLVSISDTPNAYINSPTGELILLDDTGAYQWNAGNEYRPFLWEKRYYLNTLARFNIAHSTNDGINQVTVSTNRDTQTTFNSVDDLFMKITPLNRTRRVTIVITGVHRQQELILASTIRELAHYGS